MLARRHSLAGWSQCFSVPGQLLPPPPGWPLRHPFGKIRKPILICRTYTLRARLAQVIGEAKMASKDVELTGKNNPNNSMNDKRDYEVEECVAFPPHVVSITISGKLATKQGFHHQQGAERQVMLPAGSTPATPSLHSSSGSNPGLFQELACSVRWVHVPVRDCAVPCILHLPAFGGLCLTSWWCSAVLLHLLHWKYHTHLPGDLQGNSIFSEPLPIRGKLLPLSHARF